MRLMEFSKKTTPKITLNECADMCSNENTLEECNSFEYDASSQECSLHSENGQPFGPSVLAKTTNNMAFFQQICVQEEFLCSTPYAFERRPQSILIGYAMKVHSVENLSDCLSLCLSLQHSFTLPCASVLYFYETGECIMNQLTKNEVPHLFREGIEDSLVDYFENTCLDVFCPNSVLHWLKSEDFHISNEKDVIVESMSVDECKTLCTSNTIGTEKFPCRSYIYSSLNQQCHLSADHGIIRSTPTKSQLEDLNLLSQPQFLHKMCLNTTVRCLDGSFEQITGKALNSQPYKTLSSGSSAICLSECINEGANCASASFDYEKDMCYLSGSSHSSEPQLFITSPSVDYFDKICDTAPVELKFPPAGTDSTAPTEPPTTSELAGTETPKAEAAPTLIGSEDGKSIENLPETLINSNKIEETEASAEETVVDDSEDFVEDKKTEHIKAHLTSECRMSGVSIEITFEQNTTGSIYVKDHFASCRSEFTDSNLAVLHIPFPRSDEPNPRCPGTEISTAHWSFMVVIQRNQLSSSSLVTSTDRVFNVTCDYTELIEKSQQQGLLPVKVPIPGELRSNRIKMSILRNGKPVTVVPLGDYVELLWTVIDTEVGLGYFINECVAERIGGNPPHPEPLKIIYQGCPEDKVRGSLLDDVIKESGDGYSTTMKVFRFDGSRRVRIKCTIDVCVEKCPPVICDGLRDGKRQESYGRKKRQSLQDLEGFIKKLKPNFSLPTRNQDNRTQTVLWGTLTVTEREPKKKLKPEFSALSSEHVCVFKWQVTVFLCIFSAVSITLIVFIGRVVYLRFCCLGGYDDSSSYTNSSTASIISSSEHNYSHSQQYRGYQRKEGSFGAGPPRPVIYETPCIR